MTDEEAKRMRDYEDALKKIACWDEGAEVTGSFDEPAAAKIARDALRPHRFAHATRNPLTGEWL